jgi:SAM-dependent methyltransferase
MHIMSRLIQRIHGQARRRMTRYAMRSNATRQEAVARYWTIHNVSSHRCFASAQESLDYLHWRNAQYFRYCDLMPVNDCDGLTVVDFGCGPGHDLLGFSIFSKPDAVIGIDISASSLAEAQKRLALHKVSAKLIRADVQSGPLPLPDSSVDIIHTSRVLHHMDDPIAALRNSTGFFVHQVV